VVLADGSGSGRPGRPSERWSGEDLALALDPPTNPPLRRWSYWLAERIRVLVRDGVLGYGARLPASRALSVALGVSRGVVVSAYEQLLAEGFLSARQGSGTYVAAAGGSPAVTVPLSLPPPHARPGLPDLGAFPRARWLTAYRTALTEASTADIGYGDPRGHPRLRAELAAHLVRTRAAAVVPDNVLVVGGVAFALALLADVLVAAGRRRVAVEDPASPGTCDLLRRRGVHLVPIPVDDSGIRPDVLAGADVAAVVLTAAHQYPTGALLSAARRRALITLARKRGLLLVEDDYDGSFHYGRGVVGCLQGLAPDVTVLLGSVSKTLAPSLRIGWMVAPPDWVVPLMQRRSVTDLAGPTLDQLAFAHLLDSGFYDRHVRRMRRLYLRRRQRLIAAIAEVPWLAVRGAPSGLHVLAETPGTAAEAAVCTALREAGFDVQGLADCHAAAGARAGADPAPGARSGSNSRSGVVIGFASLSDSAIDKLGAVISALPATGW
jgi:GntR family transcriptional regulator / MocR family aminotransferase